MKFLILALSTLGFGQGVGAFSPTTPNIHISSMAPRSTTTLLAHADESEGFTRRSMLESSTQSLIASLLLVNSLTGSAANAAVGTLPEFSDSNAVLQGITIDVADKVQQDAMIAFLDNGFNFKTLRKQQVGSVTETWMGFGPEEMNIPQDFEIPVSSLSKYGGHASINIRYDSQVMSAYYIQGDNAPGDNIAYLQVGVPEYRISQMVKNGGNVLDAYGIVNVVSPSGLPIRGIVGISPDPMMLVALNCQSIKQSREFYQQLGFTEQEYPYCRPNKGMGQFEPPQPKNSVYMAPSANSMGVLLLQAEKKKKSVKPNPAFRSLNIVYTPSDGTVDASSDALKVEDPSSVAISFLPYASFEQKELNTRLSEE